jgi:hypothetical protein
VGVPDDVLFQAKPDLAQQMLERARDTDVPTASVTGDEVYGRARLRLWLEAARQPFVLAVKRTEPLWVLTERGPLERAAGDITATVALEDWTCLSADVILLTVPEARRLLYRLVLAALPPPEGSLAWSDWRRRHRATARRGRWQRRLERLNGEVPLRY